MRHSSINSSDRMTGFNPRICKRCDTIKLLHGLIKKCFNPRICKRCDFGSATKQGDLPVSIHASVKDATHIFSDISRRTSFNPRICKRCDASIWIWFRWVICFNPRICKRCDRPLLVGLHVRVVSIHASVKDATPCL